ncbi:hypothetical protein SAMN06265374_3475 [Roseibium denhamense]|uniref:Uncharacterized protein n=1 Tax=Roseibium denhamense TaxID=76305 RepID=A0ABY1PDQ7_9HYPH|nr:hypothetical protein SAMN06265374_3475 [Roseibium denhamense]
MVGALTRDRPLPSINNGPQSGAVLFFKVN